MPQKKILFLYLIGFFKIGGIEKFNQAFCRALSDSPHSFRAYSAYDSRHDERYVNSMGWKGFSGNLYFFALQSLVAAYRSNLIVLGHINLALLGVLIKLFFPKKQVWLIVHGVDVWFPLSFIKRKALNNADLILSVSGFTKNKIVKLHGALPEKIVLFPNTLDPFWEVPATPQKNSYLANKYALPAGTTLLLTVARIQTRDQYKGYDKVLASLHLLKQSGRLANTHYFLVGKADMKEKKRVEALVEQHGLQSMVTLTGYVTDQELRQIYSSVDMFVMPSKGEGFGIVYIEAASFGLPCIAGDQDGSPEALLGGKLGILVDPDNIDSIAQAIENGPACWDRSAITEQAVAHFAYCHYQQRLANLLDLTLNHN